MEQNGGKTDNIRNIWMIYFFILARDFRKTRFLFLPTNNVFFVFVFFSHFSDDQNNITLILAQISLYTFALSVHHCKFE
jgi:hypothetical protein